MHIRKVRYAVIGLDEIAQKHVLPAFLNAGMNSEVVALVSGDLEKRQALAVQNCVGHSCGYEDFDSLCESGQIDSVYLTVPASFHLELTKRAAKHGVHVLSAAPLALTAQDAYSMVRACERNDAKLMSAYGLYFDPVSSDAAEIANSGRLGDLQLFQAFYSVEAPPESTLRDENLSGGPLLELGTKALYAARMIFRDLPSDVQATALKNEAGQTETVTLTLRFPHNRMAILTCSYSCAERSYYEVVGTLGSLRADRPFETGRESQLHVHRASGESETKCFTPQDQFSPMIMHFSDCILSDTKPGPSGWEGWIDLKILDAARKAADFQRSIPLDWSDALAAEHEAEQSLIAGDPQWEGDSPAFH